LNCSTDPVLELTQLEEMGHGATPSVIGTAGLTEHEDDALQRRPAALQTLHCLAEKGSESLEEPFLRKRNFSPDWPQTPSVRDV
jgi:hypothetical protein